MRTFSLSDFRPSFRRLAALVFLCAAFTLSDSRAAGSVEEEETGGADGGSGVEIVLLPSPELEEEGSSCVALSCSTGEHWDALACACAADEVLGGGPPNFYTAGYTKRLAYFGTEPPKRVHGTNE